MRITKSGGISEQTLQSDENTRPALVNFSPRWALPTICPVLRWNSDLLLVPSAKSHVETGACFQQGLDIAPPGRNIAGLTLISPALAAQRLKLRKAAVHEPTCNRPQKGLESRLP